jgi:UDP-2,3-diacylglucosamine pyrophosphatase LpxH
MTRIIPMTTLSLRAIIYPDMSCQETQPAYDRTAVISDTHFGETGALLADPENIERLMEELARGVPLGQVILLGDIWDLWRTDLATAIRAGRPFFEALSSLPGLRSLVLVFGNHDYHLYFNLAESRALREAGEAGEAGETGEASGKSGGVIEIPGLSPLLEEDAGPLRDILGVPAHIEFTVKYPFHMLEWLGRTVMLTHGHQVDFFARRFWWARTAWLARSALKRVSGVSASDLELYNAPFFEALYLFGRVPEFSERVSGWYRYLQRAARLMGISTPGRASYRRFTTIDDNSREIAAMLDSLYPGHLPDVFIFGHTHRAGSGRIQAGLHPLEVYNAGSWLEEDSATPATWLELDKEIKGLSLRPQCS